MGGQADGEQRGASLIAGNVGPRIEDTGRVRPQTSCAVMTLGKSLKVCGSRFIHKDLGELEVHVPGSILVWGVSSHFLGCSQCCIN